MGGALRGGAGGIAGLLRLLREHGEAVEADLQRYYGIRLGELVTGALTFRRLGTLVRNLPIESALGSVIEIDTAAVRDAARPRWRHGDYLLADLWDLLMHANGVPDARYPRPDARGAGDNEERSRLLSERADLLRGGGVDG